MDNSLHLLTEQEIIDTIIRLQASPADGWISSMGKNHYVNQLHKELDRRQYTGVRPPTGYRPKSQKNID